MSLPPSFLSRPIAHRCLHDVNQGRPENSFEALDAALAKQLPIEIDLQCSGDGHAIVFHDTRLDRLSGRAGMVGDMPLRELRQITLLGGQSKIPSFAEFMARVDGQVPILIELKDQSGRLKGSHAPLIASIQRSLEAYHGDVALMSFNPDLIASCGDALPQIPRGLVSDPFAPMIWPDIAPERLAHLRAIADYERVGACFVSHNHADLNGDAVRNIKKSGGKILCWTIKSQGAADRAMKIADNITFEGFEPKRI